jgi:hypothetical protein
MRGSTQTSSRKQIPYIKNRRTVSRRALSINIKGRVPAFISWYTPDAFPASLLLFFVQHDVLERKAKQRVAEC